MKEDIRILADDAKRLKNDEAFQTFITKVRDDQMTVFANSAASDVEVREEAHAMLRALNQISGTLDAAIAAEAILDRKRRN
jgi:hypothetical protein|tara:strand:- start:1363 stop:1605 length:243 start_codon:yes stop_codon:yes gene_type:complete